MKLSIATSAFALLSVASAAPNPPKPAGDVCPPTCNPIPNANKCDITTSCTQVVKKDGKPATSAYCACRAGYRANGLSPNDPRQVRLPWVGQEYRVL